MKTTSILFVLLLCVSCNSSKSQNNTAKAIDKMRVEYSRGHYSHVLRELDRIQPIAPSNYVIYEMRAWALHQMSEKRNDTTMILSNLNIAIELAPLTASQSYYLRGIISDRLGSSDLAIKDYSTVISISPTNPDTFYSYVERAILYGKQSNYVSAINDAQRAAKLYPNKYTPYLIMAKAYHDMGELGEAAKCLTNAERMAPSNQLVIQMKQELGIKQ